MSKKAFVVRYRVVVSCVMFFITSELIIVALALATTTMPFWSALLLGTIPTLVLAVLVRKELLFEIRSFLSSK